MDMLQRIIDMNIRLLTIILISCLFSGCYLVVKKDYENFESVHKNIKNYN